MKKRFLLTVAIVAASFAEEATAADTNETYGIGASNFEMYLGLDGAGLGKYEKTVWAEALAGFGITERFSGYLAALAEGNERFSAGTGGAGFGVFGTPVDTDHFDMDLFLGAGFRDGAMFLAPALELNLDARPDLALCGLYVRAEELLEGRDDSIADETKAGHSLAPTTALAFGGYFTFAEIHQLLLEFDTAFHHNGEDGSEAVEAGGVALGYNVQVVDAVELVTQVAVDVPQDGEDLAAGFMLGFVASLP